MVKVRVGVQSEPRDLASWLDLARRLDAGLFDSLLLGDEHERAALRAYRAGDLQDAFAGYAANGQIVVTGTRDEAFAAAAAIWHTHAQAYETPLQKVTEVALLAGRR